MRPQTESDLGETSGERGGGSVPSAGGRRRLAILGFGTFTWDGGSDMTRLNGGGSPATCVAKNIWSHDLLFNDATCGACDIRAGESNFTLNRTTAPRHACGRMCTAPLVDGRDGICNQTFGLLGPCRSFNRGGGAPCGSTNKLAPRKASGALGIIRNHIPFLYSCKQPLKKSFLIPKTF